MVGILNVQWFDNPGAVLLCYALQQTMAEQGRECKIINYTSGGSARPTLFDRVCRKLRTEKSKLARVDHRFFGQLLQERSARYEAFRERYLDRTAPFSDTDSPLLYGYDQYIVGSDVVWKPEILLSPDADVYFLSCLNGKKARRISYAASIGTTDASLLEPLADKYQERLKNFDFISVREAESVDFLQPLCTQKVFCMPDPVFLLEKAQYASLKSDLREGEGDYIYFYMLTPNPKAVEFAVELEARTGLKVLYDLHTSENLFLRNVFHNPASAAVCSDGPAEFLNRIRNARYVVTNSFHGTAFSLIFEKELYSFPSQNGGVDISVRLRNILDSVGLQNRYDCDPGCMEEPIEWNFVEECLQQMRQEGRDYLMHALQL